MHHGAKPWIADFKHPHYQAARKALKRGEILFLILNKKFYLLNSQINNSF